MAKNILFVHQFFVRGDEAGEVRHIKLFECLAAWKKFDFYIIGGSLNYLTGKSFPDFKGLKQDFDFNTPGLKGVRVYASPTYRKGFLGRMTCYFSFLVSSFLAALPRKKPDLVLSTSPSLFTALSGYLISRMKGVPFYFEVRDLWPQAPVEMGMLKNKSFISLSYRLEKFLAQKAEKLIVLTTGYRDYFVDLGVAPEKIYVLPNGADEEWLEYQNPQIPPEINELKKAGKFTVMYAGAIGKFNYLEKLLEAARILKDDPAIHFVLIGDGNARLELEEKAKALGLDNVSFWGSKKRGEIPPYLANADLGVIIYPDIPLAKTLMMNKLLDCLALGVCPLLAAKEGVSTGILQKADSGIITGYSPEEIAEKIKAAKNDPELIKERGKKGREYVKIHYNRQKLAEELWVIINQ